DGVCPAAIPSFALAIASCMKRRSDMVRSSVVRSPSSVVRRGRSLIGSLFYFRKVAGTLRVPSPSFALGTRSVPATLEYTRNRPGFANYGLRTTDYTLLRKVRELDILEGYRHGAAGVELQGDDPLVGHLGELLVHRRLAVELDGDALADALDVVVVEIVLLDHFR